MQNKKSLLKRLLVIYVTFFIVLVAGFAHNIIPNLSRGAAEGLEMGNDITRKWNTGDPRMIFLLDNVRILAQPQDTLSFETPQASVQARIRNLELLVEKNAPGKSPVALAFRAIGGSVWIYLLVMLVPLLMLAIIILMFVIIHSLRRSIREEHPLDPRNVRYLRTIGLLTIASELLEDLLTWIMNSRAADLLTGSGYLVDTRFQVSYTPIIMGILILFAAEVFAVGQNLSEEQKLTI